MASQDPLLLLRNSIAASKEPSLTKSGDSSTAEDEKTDRWAEATHLYFSHPSPVCLPLNSPTRFFAQQAEETQVDLRSVFFAWTKRESTVPEYIADATELDKQLPEGQKIQILVYIQRLDLISWLEGADDSDYLRPLEGGAAAEAASKAADVAGGAGVPTVPGTGVAVTQQTGAGRPIKVIDARLQAIYNGERRMGDHNSVLRGTKPTDFSYLNVKCADIFGIRKPSKPSHSRTGQNGHPLPSRSAPIPNKPAASTVNAKRSDPIILLSPSASSLIRLSNIKSFLEQGIYVPADHPELSSQLGLNVLHITRSMKTLSEKPFRFILVDSPEQFKPEYWNRVVAVFTTGQRWQFSSYKWREPQELFGHVLGIFVGERGQPVPGDVKSWGSSVKTFAVERWNEKGHGTKVSPEVRSKERWKDREVVEEVWRAVENYMRGKGEWKR